MSINKIAATLTQTEIDLAQYCLAFARQAGAQKVRITLSKSLMNLIGLLNGEVDKTAHALDRSLQLQLFVEGRYGAFSTNKLEKEGLEEFIREAIDTVKMLQEDSCRDLPAPERVAKDARTGRELGLYDPAYDTLTAEQRREMALASCHWPCGAIAEEGEYSDSVFDTLTIDSQGLYARHTETSFEIGYETTVEDAQGNHFSSYWWDATPLLKDLQWKDCAEIAYKRALAQVGVQDTTGGKYTVVVDTECASTLLTPVLNALGGFALQQKNSFLVGSLGKQLFPEQLTILDLPRTAHYRQRRCKDVFLKYLHCRQDGNGAHSGRCYTRKSAACGRLQNAGGAAGGHRRLYPCHRLQRRQFQPGHGQFLLRHRRLPGAWRKKGASGAGVAHHRQFPAAVEQPGGHGR